MSPTASGTAPRRPRVALKAGSRHERLRKPSRLSTNHSEEIEPYGGGRSFTPATTSKQIKPAKDKEKVSKPYSYTQPASSELAVDPGKYSVGTGGKYLVGANSLRGNPLALAIGTLAFIGLYLSGHGLNEWALARVDFDLLATFFGVQNNLTTTQLLRKEFAEPVYTKCGLTFSRPSAAAMATA